MFLVLTAGLLVAGAGVVQHPQPASSADTARAVRAESAPVIDGHAFDAVWEIAPRHAAFRQFEPHPDTEPSFPTEFQVSFDDRSLYVLVRARDPEPDSIMRALTRRDVRGPSDQIRIIIDAFNDRRTGFEFIVNPDGVKRDFAVYNDGEENGSWNGVWEVATLVDSAGWLAEFRIPFSQLRFSEAASHTFGFGVWRDIERYNERVSWPLYSTTRTGLISQLGRLEGVAGIDPGARIELTPYAVTRNVSRAAATGHFQRVQQLDAGGDLRIGITPAITLDATVNPDFGQIEADPAVLNLTAFETFLGERRPFFVEGTGLYRFPLNCYTVVDCSTNEGIFHSRRIGRAPTLRDTFGDASTPASTPIAAAAKFTGRTQHGLSFGLLEAWTPRVAGAGETTVEPRTNHIVVRAQQDLRNGDAGIGMIATAVNRSLDEWTRPLLHGSAYVLGTTARTRMFGGQYELAGSFAASRVTGSPAAIERTQQNPVHYYQQPGDDLSVDPARTALTGYALHAKFGKYGGGITRFETSYVRQSAGFEVNDLGFLRRADLEDWSTWAALSFREPRGVIRWMQFNANHWQTWNSSGRRLENAVNLNGHMGFSSNWNIHAGATLGRLGTSYCDRCTRGGPALRRSRYLAPWFGINGDGRTMLVPSLWVNLLFADEGRTHSLSLNPSIAFRPSTQLRVQLGAGLRDGEEDMQWYDNFVNELSGATQHAFAHLDQRTLSLNVRVEYSATPDLTFEFYGEPFVSSGTWSDFREVSGTPGAADYDARLITFTPPAGTAREFMVMQLRTNSVLRWEYRPGSTLFLVWSHGREGRLDERSEGSWRDDYDALFDLHPENTFLIKFAYWLSR